MKTREEIVGTAMMDWNNKRKSDDNWFKSRVEGAWDSGYANGRAEADDRDDNAVSAQYLDGYNEGLKAGKDLAFLSFAGWTPNTVEEIIKDAKEKGKEEALSLVEFDKKAEYQRGLSDAWNLLIDIYERMSPEEIDRFFGVEGYTNGLYGVLNMWEPEQAFDRFDEFCRETPVKTNAQKFEEVFGRRPIPIDLPENICSEQDAWWAERYVAPNGNKGDTDGRN